MPTRPKTYRATPPQPPRPRRDTRRGDRHQRGYSDDWYKLRRWYLAKNPLCARCGLPATMVDHIVPIRVNRGLRLNLDNLQSLCNVCHGIKTAEDRRTYEEYD